MQIVKPNYYDAFRCLAGGCPDSCCHSWAVAIDEEYAAFYRSLPGELGDLLRDKLREDEGETILSLNADGRCPMWRDDGLCRLQYQLGETALCDVCRNFPRLRHDYGTFAELGLELSCPEAARLILESEHRQIVRTEAPGGEEPDYEPEVMDILLRSREEVFRLLEDTRFTPPQILAILLLYGYRVQAWLDGGDEAVLSPDADLAAIRSMAQEGSISDILAFYSGLEILTDRWRQRLAAPSPALWSEEFRRLARYFVERYYLQAVSDYDLVGRVKYMIVSCLTIRTLGGDLLDTAQLYSKEIENDPDNVDTILDSAYTAPALRDTALLGLLLKEGN